MQNPTSDSASFEEGVSANDAAFSSIDLNLGAFPSGSFIAFTMFFNIIPQRDIVRTRRFSSAGIYQ